MKVTLQVNGRKMTFSKKELVTILEKHFSSETTHKVSTAKVAEKPTEGEWFEVKPQSINQKLFKKKRRDKSQEGTRQLILEAFDEMKNNPEKYGRNFKTMMPKKTWGTISIDELKEMACKLGDHNADWVEQALEWAQRIANGETWKAICNDKDTANWYRLVINDKGYPWFIGGSANNGDEYSASDIDFYDYFVSFRNCQNTVPLVVLYEK